MSRPGKVEVYPERESRSARPNGRWRWRAKARNGQVVDGPQQGFSRKWNAKRSARSQKPGWPIIEVES